MDAKRLVRVSKYLSRHLRHQPQRLGLTLAPGGWVEVQTLLDAAEGAGFGITREELLRVVADNDKQRFAFDETAQRIRANQGHSVPIDLQLEPASPPDVLYHGTAEQHVPAIRKVGLARMSRHHVHLSTTTETATRVGRRHGRPVLFAVDAAAMSRDGFVFYRSDNGVWLVDEVPADYLTVVQGDETQE